MIVILNNIRSLHNVGSIFRTADGVGVEKLYLAGYTPSVLDVFGAYRPEISKVALGAEMSVPWEKVSSAATLIKKLKKQGYKIFAVEQSKNSVPYDKISKLHPPAGGSISKICLVFGAEVKGLPPSVLKLCDRVLEIPMRGAMVRQAHHPRRLGRGKESLNVSVAAGIVMYEMRKMMNKKP